MGRQTDYMEKFGRSIYKNDAPFRVNVPTGKAGPWTIKHFETQLDLQYARLALEGRAPGIGKFTMLTHKDRGVVMSDTAAEINDLRPYLFDLTGHVLVTGLGLGMTLHALTKVPRYSKYVKSITVIEKDKNVIKLVGEHYIKSDPRIVIFNENAYTWLPPKGTMFDSAWHDIWDNITTDNKPLFSKMRNHYKKVIKGAGRQFIWGEEAMKRQKQRYG